MSTPAMVTAAAGTGHRITADEYEAMIRDGVLTENDKVELIDGQLEEIVPQGEGHVWAVDELDEQLGAMSDGTWHSRKEHPARVSDYDEPEPDIVVATGTRRGMKGRRPRAEEILLVTEVAATTQEYDRGEKRERYARARTPGLLDRRPQGMYRGGLHRSRPGRRSIPGLSRLWTKRSLCR